MSKENLWIAAKVFVGLPLLFYLLLSVLEPQRQIWRRPTKKVLVAFLGAWARWSASARSRTRFLHLKSRPIFAARAVQPKRMLCYLCSPATTLAGAAACLRISSRKTSTCVTSNSGTPKMGMK